MRELYDPVYYPPVIQGFDEYHHYQQYRPPPPQYQPPPPVVKSSSSSSSSSSVLGKFLKLGKSKSDAGTAGFSTSGLLSPSPSSTSAASVSRSGGGDRRRGSGGGGGGSSESCELDEFRLSPSVIARGPVQKMVHNKANKRDVSRSHSWIYGSVKLASDLPFGYGDQFSTFQGGGEEQMMEGHHGQYGHGHHLPSGASPSQSHYLHTHGLHAMQIPRCQLDYSCTCDCGDGGRDYMNPGGSVRNGVPSSRRGKPPCQGCAREMAMKYALPSGSSKSGRGTTSSSGGGNSSESFVSSVRKLTWKSLKQVVKKRPSLDTLKKMPPQQQMMGGGGGPPSEYLSAPIVPMPYLSPSAVAAATATQQSPMMVESPNMNPMANPQNHYGHGHVGAGTVVQSPPMSPQPQQAPHPNPDYFFPEKKQFFASCNDIYERGGNVGPPSPPNHVTASVRVRPKRTRQPWQFPGDAPSSEFGPVPNYEEDGGEGNPSGLYHSEWDLRNVMSYDMWMNATSNVKPRTGTTTVAMGPSSGGNSTTSSKQSARSHSADARHYHSSGNLHVPPPDYGNPAELPTTFRPQKQSSASSVSSTKTSSGKIITNGKGSVSSSKSLTSLHSPLPSSSNPTSSKGGSISSSHSSDTLKISSFSNSPSNSNKTTNAGIVKRGSILAADVTAYQLLKQQTKKGAQSSSSSSAQSSQQPSVKSAPRQQSILKNKQPTPVEIEDAFSESSDDLSDNAITGPSSGRASDSASIKSRSSTGGSSTASAKTSGGLGVRIAGQGIRMTKSSSVTVASPQKSPSVTMVTTSASVTATSRPTKRENASLVTTITTTGSSESESDVWSDCHAEPTSQRRGSTTVTTTTTSSSMKPSSNGKSAHQQQLHILSSGNNKTASVKVNGANNNKRQTFVTFEKQPPQPPQLPPTALAKVKQASHHETDMEFEEYEVVDRRKVKEEMASSQKSRSDNVVSLNVTSPSPSSAFSSSTSGSGSHNPQQPKATYIKHGKSSSSSSLSTSSSSAAASKFGALRRRKSRNANVVACTTPGKLLQETIYEEEDPDGDQTNDADSGKSAAHVAQRGQSPHHVNHSSSSKSSPSNQTQQQKHSVKIMIGAGASTPSPTTVKPILKNRDSNLQRTYETPVITATTANNNAVSSNDNSCKNDINNYFSNNRTGTYHQESNNNNTDSSADQQQIYFDSSVSTASAKKKVQFDQSKVVVCGGSSSSSSGGSDAGSGPDEEDQYDYENDDSDQWSNKSEDEDEQVHQQQSQQPQQLSSFGGSGSPPHHQSHHHQQQPPQQKIIQDESTDKAVVSSAPRARSLFEEEVVRKAASFARSRQLKKEQEEQQQQLQDKNANTSDKDVNNLHQRRNPQQSTSNISSSSSSNGDCSSQSQGKSSSSAKTTTTTTSCSSNKNATNSQGNSSNNGTIVASNKSNVTSGLNNNVSSTIQACHNGGSSNKNAAIHSSKSNNKSSSNNANAPRLTTFQNGNSTKQTGNSNASQQVVLNPNSLLFHDTTRIRLNQSRPALHDNTFKLPNGNGSSTGSPNSSGKNGRGVTRLKQSNSFRSVSSLALRPREPPPPPPTFSVAKGSSALASMPARLHKALSTSTLLSKSTEKLNLANLGKGGGQQSHYGLGGRLLPSKSQISLPMGFTTTSKAAGLLAGASASSVSMDKLNLTSNHSPTTVTSKKRDSPPSKSTLSLASRSKSLTDRCEALEKVLREQKKGGVPEPDQYRSSPVAHAKLRPAPSLGSLVTSPLPKDDMDSKSIEIVTKENDVSEIRIYSSSTPSSSQNNSGGYDENLPYQGIIYESTKTVITTEPQAVVLPPPPVAKSAVPPPRPSPPEIHYAATDLFPSQQQQPARPDPPTQKVTSPKSSPPAPFSHPPLPPIPPSTESEYECTGKSVVLIIDNNKKNKKADVIEETTPLPNYSQPIDTIPRGTHHHPPPQIPLPSLPSRQADSTSDNFEEPLYDDVINHSAPVTEMPPPVPKSNSLAGSLGRKSLKGVVISPPHQLGELPPLPAPPVPPHRTPFANTSPTTTTTKAHEVVSSTLPCLACPPSLPPPNLPSKSLSEFQNRPLVIQENEEESILEEEVDNLYNDIGTPSNTMKSSTAAQFATAMKEAFLGAIGSNGGNKRNSGDFSDRRSVHSTGSGSSVGTTTTTKKLITPVVTAAAVGEQQPQLIYDDTLSISSSGGGSTSSSSSCGGSAGRIINHHAPTKKTVQQQMVPLPLPPPQQLSNKSSKELNNLVEENEEDNEEPLYDDVLNLTEQTEISSNKNNNNKKDDISSNRRSINGGASEYHSSNSSDSGTEDLPPPLPAQGPPPLPKELPLLTFPLLTSQPSSLQQSTVTKSSSTLSSTTSTKSKEETHNQTIRSTRTLLSELNEKLSKLNVSSSNGEGGSNEADVPCSSSSPSGSSDASSGEFNSDSFHISKVVISPSSESSGVEEDYNSEKNYSLRGGGSSNGSTSSRGGSDNENTYGNNKKKTTAGGGGVQSSITQQKAMPSEAISMARGKFLENMKLSMLGGAPSPPATSASSTSAVAPATVIKNNDPKGLLMMSPKTTDLEVEEDEPIYEEIGESLQNKAAVNKTIITSPPPNPAIVQQAAGHHHEEEDEDADDDRSTSPVYADAFDAKSMFDGASRSEILSFLESIRDRLTGTESASSSESRASSISRSSSAKKSVDEPLVSVGDSKSSTTEETLMSIGEDGESMKPEASTQEGNQEGEQEMQIKVGSGGILKEGSSQSSAATATTGEVGVEEILILEKERKLLCTDCNDDIEEAEEGEQNNNNNSQNQQQQHEHHDQEEDPTVTTGLAHPGSSLRDSCLEDPSKRKCCRSCNRKRNEKKEIIMEIYETELKYGRDLRIVSEEFYKPIQVAGLLTKEQLDQIFLNVDQLIQINLELTGRLKQEIQRSQQRKLSLMSTINNNNSEASNKKEDELSEVNVGKIFLELGETMMTAFENYCTRQANAGSLLSQLEKEKELLRIFLRVSQMENTVLRRMNLPAFLMVPVQRVTRYPLLLARLLKVTPVDHFSREELQSAQEKIEQHLEHMNKTTREVASVKLWRRISIINGSSSSSSGPGGAHRRSNSDLDSSNIRIRKMALDVLDWTAFNDVTCVLDNQLGSVHFNGKLMRNIYGCLLVRGKDLELLASKIQDQDPFFPPAAEDVVKDVKLVLVRVKNTRFCLLREPLCLSKCVVSQGENEFQEFIEINEITTKNTYFIQGLDRQGTATWLRFLQCYSSCVGHWRRRRPALANIMMNGMIKHL